MRKFFFVFIAIALLLLPLYPVNGEGGNPTKNLDLAGSVSRCGSQKNPATNRSETPPNCLFLEEPIGGRPNVDLYVKSCNLETEECTYKLWGGQAIGPTEHGPLQAILTREAGKSGEEQALTLLYNYLGLIYRYLSGIIVGVVVLFIIVGGIQMTTSYGDTGKFDEGKKRITNAITGMILWFVSSLLLYSINPTFFAF